MTDAQLQALCEVWQKRLRLQDWRIVCEIKRAHEMPEGAQACVNPTFALKQAEIWIVDPIDYLSDAFEQHIEQSLVHELLHLHLWWPELDDKTERGLAFEQGIDLIGWALVEGYGKQGNSRRSSRKSTVRKSKKKPSGRSRR